MCSSFMKRRKDLARKKQFDCELIYLMLLIKCRRIHEPESLKAFSSNHHRKSSIQA